MGGGGCTSPAAHVEKSRVCGHGLGHEGAMSVDLHLAAEEGAHPEGQINDELTR